MEKSVRAIRISIAFKFIALLAGLLVASVAGVTWLSTHLFLEDNTALIRQFNANSADNLSSQVEEIIESLTEGARLVASALSRKDLPQQQRDSALAELFEGHRGLLGVCVVRASAGGGRAITEESALSAEVRSDSDPRGERACAEVLEAESAAQNRFSLKALFADEPQARLFQLGSLGPVVTLATPYSRQAGATALGLVALIKPARISEPFGRTDGVAAFLVDRGGFLVAHSDRANVSQAEDLSKSPVVTALLDGGLSNQQIRYVDPASNEPRLAAVRRVGFAGMGVVAELPEATAQEASARVVRLSAFAALVFLGIAIFGGSHLAALLVRPINFLVDSADRVAHGDFRQRILVRGWDELSFLSASFNQMIQGLAEREKFQDTLRKFHDPQIADKIASGELKLNAGARRQAVILFCDIRGFTGMSEEMEPEQVVELLNEYFTRMVDVIQSRGGVVDKYVGDAILAVWGVPEAGTDDTIRAVVACLEMRKELAKLNALRIGRGQVPLRIGIGLHRGPVVAGTIGSASRMEYTVIGDAVNLASRIEGLTKTFGTDLLISREVFDAIKDHFVCTPCESTTVKGKALPVELFRVQGTVDSKGRKELVQTPYSSTDPRLNPADTTGARMVLPPVFRKPSTEKTWFIRYGSDILGPFSTELVRQGLADGSFEHAMEIAPERDGPWSAIAAVPEFADITKKGEAA